MKQYVYSRRWLRKTVGVLLIAFGLIGLVMPVVPGAVLAIIGLELVGIRLAFFDRFFPGRRTTALSTEVPLTPSVTPTAV